MKEYPRIRLESNTLRKLKQKAEDSGFTGRSWLSNYLTMLATTDLIYVDKNINSFITILKPLFENKK